MNIVDGGGNPISSPEKARRARLAEAAKSIRFKLMLLIAALAAVAAAVNYIKDIEDYVGRLFSSRGSGEVSTQRLVDAEQREIERRRELAEGPPDVPSVSYEHMLTRANPDMHSKMLALLSLPDNRGFLLLIHACAGFGKSFIVEGVLRQACASRGLECVVVRLKSVATATDQRGKSVAELLPFKGREEPDLIASNGSASLVINSLPSVHLAEGSLPALLQVVGATPDKVVIIDDLDEISSSSATRVLDEIRGLRIANPSWRFVVMGRTEAVSPYLAHYGAKLDDVEYLRHPLATPDFFLGDIDLRVANFLHWHIDERKRHPVVKVASQEHVTSTTAYLQSWIHAQPSLWLSMGTATASGALIERSFNSSFPTSEADSMSQAEDPREWLAAVIFGRNSDSHNRPSMKDTGTKKDLYFRALYKIAAESVDRIDKNGFFSLPDPGTVRVDDYVMQSEAALHRSGVVSVYPADNYACRYRFEPLWIHRYLAEKFNSLIARGGR
jgi:hypothetical protein